MEHEEIERILKNAKYVHLTEEELDAYCDEELGDVTLARAKAHLNLCLICEQRLALLREERAALEQLEITADDIALVHRLLQKQPEPKGESTQEDRGTGMLKRLTAQLGNLVLLPDVSLTAVRASTEPPWQDREIGEGTLFWDFDEDEAGNLIISVGSHIVELKGVQLRLKAGDWERDVSLVEVDPGQVGTETIMAQEDRARLPMGTELRIVDLFREDSNAGRTDPVN